MIQIWHDLLQEQGALYQENVVERFAQNVCHETNFFLSDHTCFDLSHYGILKVEGQDAFKLLQGQLSCNLQEVDNPVFRLGAYCNIKGRVETLFFIFKHEQAYYLQMPYPLIASTLSELQKYALFSKVKLHDLSNDWISIGISGTQGVEQLSMLFDSIPLEPNTYVCSNDVHILNHSGNDVFCFELTAPYKVLRPIWKKLSALLTPIGHNAFELHQIRKKIPTIFPQTQAKLLPHHLNLKALRAISFDKGCYRGQEVIARMEYKGKIKKHLYHAISRHLVALPQPGCEICIKTNNDFQVVGTLIRVALTENKAAELLLILDNQYTEETLYLGTNPSNKLSILEACLTPSSN